MRQFEALVRRELQRADRFRTNFSLIRLELPHGPDGAAGDPILDWILKRVREIDEVGWLDQHLGILLPETDDSGAWVLLGDLRACDTSGCLRDCVAEIASYAAHEAPAPVPREPTNAVAHA